MEFPGRTHRLEAVRHRTGRGRAATGSDRGEPPRPAALDREGLRRPSARTRWARTCSTDGCDPMVRLRAVLVASCSLPLTFMAFWEPSTRGSQGIPRTRECAARIDDRRAMVHDKRSADRKTGPARPGTGPVLTGRGGPRPSCGVKSRSHRPSPRKRRDIDLNERNTNSPSNPSQPPCKPTPMPIPISRDRSWADSPPVKPK